MTEPITEAVKPVMKWYIVHTYSGYEHKAKAALEERVRSLHKEEKIGKVLVPIERVQELGKGGARKVSSRKFFPGYIFVQMVLDDETWHVIKDTPKITGFVGHSTNPPEVPISEVAEIEQQMEEGALRPKPKVLFEVGEAINSSTAPSRTSTAPSRKSSRRRARCAFSFQSSAAQLRSSWTLCR